MGINWINLIQYLDIAPFYQCYCHSSLIGLTCCPWQVAGSYIVGSPLGYPLWGHHRNQADTSCSVGRWYCAHTPGEETACHRSPIQATVSRNAAFAMVFHGIADSAVLLHDFPPTVIHLSQSGHAELQPLWKRLYDRQAAGHTHAWSTNVCP